MPITVQREAGDTGAHSAGPAQRSAGEPLRAGGSEQALLQLHLPLQLHLRLRPLPLPMPPPPLQPPADGGEPKRKRSLGESGERAALLAEPEARGRELERRDLLARTWQEAKRVLLLSSMAPALLQAKLERRSASSPQTCKSSAGGLLQCKSAELQADEQRAASVERRPPAASQASSSLADAARDALAAAPSAAAAAAATSQQPDAGSSEPARQQHRLAESAAPSQAQRPARLGGDAPANQVANSTNEQQDPPPENESALGEWRRQRHSSQLQVSRVLI